MDGLCQRTINLLIVTRKLTTGFMANIVLRANFAGNLTKVEPIRTLREGKGRGG
jgi:hypothetical protein